MKLTLHRFREIVQDFPADFHLKPENGLPDRVTRSAQVSATVSCLSTSNVFPYIRGSACYSFTPCIGHGGTCRGLIHARILGISLGWGILLGTKNFVNHLIFCSIFEFF